MNLKINGSWLYCVEQIPILIVCYLTIHLCLVVIMEKNKNFSADQRSR